MRDKVLAVGLIILLCIQYGIIFINYKSEIKNDSSIPVIAVNKDKKKTFSEFFLHINSIENSNIKNISNNKDHYSANIEIKGSKENILLGLNSLDEYNIKSYKLNVIESEINANINIIFNL